MSSNHWAYKIELSAILTIIGIILLFSGAVGVTLIAPSYIDPTWTQPTSQYQVQMYEVADPNIYLSTLRSDSTALQAVYHLKKDFTLLAFQESEALRFIAPPELEKYITKLGDQKLKLTSQLILLRRPAEQNQNASYDVFELFIPSGDEAFAVAQIDRIIEDWIDKDFVILDETTKQEFHKDRGVIYVNNPFEFKIAFFKFGGQEGWKYDPINGKSVANINELKQHPLGFRSRKEMIQYGEHLYAIEGCWYCHTDQTRTLIQDVTLNGSDSFPAPPSSANEYIYQKITFPGTKRNGPDLSRVGVKRPSRDWHQSHFWSPKTASKGSIMPSFQHFFDYDPRGTEKRTTNIPNYKFEALFQYLMTKGTRITPPTEAWWLGKDPVNTLDIIEGKRK